MGKISGEEGFISLGPWGSKRGAYWAYKPDGPIMQITIGFDDIINSILFESKSFDSVLIGNPHKFGSDGPRKQMFCIDTSVEQLSSISLTYGDYLGKSKPAIGSLYFNTDQNRYGVTGNCTGDFSSVSIPIKGGVIAGFHGRAETYINAFGMFVAPKVDHKGKNSCEEGSISLGPWGGGNGVDWACKLDRPITQISIRYGYAIESIVFESKSDIDGGIIEGSEKIGGDGGDEIETFCIDSSKEQVSSIILTFGLSNWEVAIRTLGIKTNLRTYGPFGLRTGDSSVSIPIEGGVLTGFHGRLGRYISAIGVFVAPKINTTLPSSGKELVDGLHSNQDSDASTSQLKGKISDKEAEQKKGISGKEGCISLGPWGGEDGEDWIYKPDGRLLQICILYGKAIHSVVFASKTYDGVVIGSCKKIGCNGGTETKTICIDTSVEELMSINLTYERCDGQVTIISFSIHTNRNNYWPFGRSSGASSLSIPIRGGVFAGLHGRVVTSVSGSRITAIGVLLTPKVNSLLSTQDLDSAPKKDPDAAPTHHKGKISNEDGWISLGPWGEKDGKEWAYKPEMPKMKISIRYGQAIHSISFDGVIIGRSEIIADTRGHVTETFCIDTSEEQLSSISLTYESLSGQVSIMSLCFYTNLNKYGPFGLRSGASFVSIPIEGGVIAGFHGYVSTYLSALGIYVVPKFNRLHSIRDSTSAPTQNKVLGSGSGSKLKALENIIHNAASSSSSANTNKDDQHHGGAPSPSSEVIRKALLPLHLEKLQKLRSSESDFVELGKDIEKLKFQIPLTSTNKEDHHDGALSPTSKMIRGDLILVDRAFAKAMESMYDTNVKINQAHEEFNRLQSLKSNERDSDELRKAESDQKRKADSAKLRKAIAKLKVQTSSHGKIRSANSNIHRSNWDSINEAKDGMVHFFYKEPVVPRNTTDDGLLKDFRELPEPLRCCLSCFFKFPPMATIKRTSMIYLWIGQGYISRLLNNEGYIWDVEVLARKIFDELIAKGFIEPIHQNRSFEPDSCRMSLSVRSSLYKEAEDRGFTSNNSLDLDLGFVCGNLEGHSCLINVGEAIINCPPEIFENMTHMRSLYLGRWQSLASHQTHHIELANAKILHGLIKVKSLKFLSLRGISLITELPTFISELNSLMILDLRACHNLEVIPNEIGLFKSLTHLDMSECYFLEHMPESLAQLSNLQVLKGFLIGDFNNKQSCTLRDLSKLSKLRKLNVYISVKDILKLEDLENLESFEGLKKLTISWGGCSLQAQVEVITKAFQIAALPPKLHKLDLQGIPTTSLLDCLMPSKLKELKKLYIRGGKLCDLGQFREPQREQWNVEILSLKYLSNLKIHWSELRLLFPKLIYLNQVECPMSDFPCDERGMWMNKEAIDTHGQLQKYLRTSGMISSSSMPGSGPTLAQDDSNIYPVDEKQH